VPVVPTTDDRCVRDIGENKIDSEKLKYLATSMHYYEFLY
jgi:hypothetical protein